MSQFLKVPQKVHHALILVSDLAEAFVWQEPISLKEIATEENISHGFLEEIAADLKEAGIIKSVRGAYGGYLLARKPNEITVADIVIALEGPIAVAPCVGAGLGCPVASSCSSKNTWDIVQEKIAKTLEDLRLSEILELPEEVKQKQKIKAQK